jgi:PAS domain S-box-containing protein
MFFQDGQPVDFVGAVLDITERKHWEQTLRESEARIAAVFDVLPIGICLADVNGRIVVSNPEMDRFLRGRGLPSSDETHRPRWRSWHPDGRLLEAHELPGSRASRGERVVPGIEMLFTQDDDGREIWTQVAGVPIKDSHGRITGVVWAISDIDTLKRTEEALRKLQERQAVLVAELQHRTRNLLAVVRGTCEMTIRTSAGLGDFAANFYDRLGAIARVNDLVSRLQDGGDRVNFDQLLRGELMAVGDIEAWEDKVILKGPGGVALPSSTLQTFALAIHELCTNALKYGALSQPDGRLIITWDLKREDDGLWLNVDWLERGVAMSHLDTTSQRVGTGRKLIERALPYQLNARTMFTMTPDGVHCTISMLASERAAA